VDKDGGRSPEATHTVQVRAVEPQGGTLAIGGTPGNDQIVIRPAAGPGTVEVKIGNTTYGPFSPSLQVVAYGQDGNDTIAVESKRVNGQDVFVTVPVVLDGGDGDDDLDARGSAGGAVLLGRGGRDDLRGGLGRDVLIGGTDRDDLRAGGEGDLLFGGSTAHDDDPAALDAIAAEWRRTDVPLSVRKQHLSGTLPGGLNGPYVMHGVALQDDGERDDLSGDDGLDWLLAQPGDKTKRR
jgi:Ca2+-binding RTX toxin-like protein